MYNLQTSNINYKFVGQTIIIIGYIFQNYLNLRYYKRTRNLEIPETIKNLKEIPVNEEEFKKSRTYTGEKLAFGIIKSTINTVIIFALFQFNYFPFLWNLVLSFTTSNLLSIYLFTALDGIRNLIISTPLSYYSTFVLEEKYGYNKTTLHTFMMDIIKQFFLGLIINGLFLYGIIALVLYFDDNFVIYSWIFTILIYSGLMLIYPSVIAPLFNTFTNLDDNIEKEKQLSETLTSLCKSLNFPLGKLYKMDGSKRTAHSQAYYFGLFKQKQIVVYDNLLEILDTDEIEAVVCHELGHWYYMHIVYLFVGNLAFLGGILYLFSFTFKNDKMYYDYGFDDKHYFMGLILFFTFIEPIGIMFQAMICAVTRMNEFQADKFAFQQQKGKQLISGLVKLCKKSQVDIDPDELYSFFNHTHPNLYQRVSTIKKLMSKSK